MEIGPWTWSSGQRAHLLLRRSEFESHWTHKFIFEMNENKLKGTGVGLFKNIDIKSSPKFPGGDPGIQISTKKSGG